MADRLALTPIPLADLGQNSATTSQIIQWGGAGWEVADPSVAGGLRRADVVAGEATTSNFSETTITLDATPDADSDVIVFVNGIQAILADGAAAAAGADAECYFALTGDTTGATAVDIADITSSHFFYWKGTNATYDLDTGDTIKFSYTSVQP